MQTFAGFSGEWESNNSGEIENVDLSAFGRYIFGTLGNKAKLLHSISG